MFSQSEYAVLAEKHINDIMFENSGGHGRLIPSADAYVNITT